MGVRGAARREQKPRAKLEKPVMKPYSFVPEPPSAFTRPTSPTPPPSLVPEPEIRPRLRDDLPPPVRANQLQQNHHTGRQAISRNLLISPVKSKTTRNNRTTTRQPSSRGAGNAQKQTEQEQESEEAFTVEFRVYPFPPSNRPLCYPLAETPHFTGSHAESDSLQTSRKDTARKMLLKRWRDELAAQEKVDIGSTMRDTPSDASQRRLTDSPRVTQKRGRSPPPIDESDDDVPVIQTMSGVVHSTASAPFDLDEGDPVLPMVGAGRTVEVRSNGSGRKASRGDSTEFRRIRSHERFQKYSRAGERNSSKRNAAYCPPMTAEQSALPHWIGSRESDRIPRRTIEDGFPGATHRGNGRGGTGEESSDEILSKPPDGTLRAMKNRIYALKDRRRLLEQRELDEIATEAARNNSVTVTKEDRVMLKEQIETLSKQAVRDLLRLMSRRMNGLESSPQAEVKEVKLSLDILPADLTKELKLMVLREKGLFALPASDELQKVRAELRNAVQEYRRRRGLTDL